MDKKKKSFLVFSKNGDKLIISERTSSLIEKSVNVIDNGEKLLDSKNDFNQDSVNELSDNSDFEFLLSDSESDSEYNLESSANNEGSYVAVCDVCGLKFKRHNALISHRKWKHTNVIKHECEYCGRSFRDSFCLKRHLKRVHTEDGSIRDKFRSLCCSLCSFKAPEGILICKHYNKAHGYDMTEERLRFSSTNDFYDWKRNIERATKSRFIKCRGSRSNMNGTVITIFSCHRSGFYNSMVKERRKRNLKSSGSNKINGFCPASISCTEFNGQIVVKYMPTHIGHNFDIEKLGLTEEEKEFIANKLVNKVPMDRILEDLNETVAPEERKRIHLTTRKDFYNIIQKYNLKKMTVYSQFKNEWKRFNEWLEQLKQSSNVVRFHKPLGELIGDYSEFKTEDFGLILASDEQLEILKNHHKNCVCVDNVYKVNINDFELYTLLVLDEIRECFPCAFIFSSRVDDNALRVYFKIIKSLIECELTPRHFVSDWANGIFNTWASTFEELPGRNLFTCNHIEREWRKNLNKIKSKEKQNDVFEQIKLLLNIYNFTEFKVLSKDIIKNLSCNYETKIFANYLQRFLNEPHSWAPCYRLNAEINKCLNIDELHKNIEYFLVKNKKVKCLTNTAEAMVHYAIVKYNQRNSSYWKEKFETKINQIVSRHHMSTLIQESIVEITDSGWNVVSVENNVEERYLVFRDDHECSCSLICPECTVCMHAFSCTCPDATVELNMCSHIHLIVACLQSNILSDYVEPHEVLEVQVNSNETNILTEIKSEEDELRSETLATDMNEDHKISIVSGCTDPRNLETSDVMDTVILENDSSFEELLNNVKSENNSESQVSMFCSRKFTYEANLEANSIDCENEPEQIALEVIVES